MFFIPGTNAKSYPSDRGVGLSANASFNLCHLAEFNFIFGQIDACEDLCWNHIRQIKHALGIEGVITTESPWNIVTDKKNEGPKIDLIINRDDRYICMCEMKFTRGEFEVKKSYNITLLERMDQVQEIIGNKKTIMSILVTTYGIKRNEYASRFDKVITMEDLFQK